MKLLKSSDQGFMTGTDSKVEVHHLIRVKGYKGYKGWVIMIKP